MRLSGSHNVARLHILNRNRIMKEDFFKAIHDYLEKVTEDNFSSMYDGLKAIILDYNRQGMGREGKLFMLLSMFIIKNLVIQCRIGRMKFF